MSQTSVCRFTHQHNKGTTEEQRVTICGYCKMFLPVFSRHRLFLFSRCLFIFHYDFHFRFILYLPKPLVFPIDIFIMTVTRSISVSFNHLHLNRCVYSLCQHYSSDIYRVSFIVLDFRNVIFLRVSIKQCNLCVTHFTIFD